MHPLSNNRPTSQQLNYLRILAQRAGVSPATLNVKTSQQAAELIQQLKNQSLHRVIFPTQRKAVTASC